MGGGDSSEPLLDPQLGLRIPHFIIVPPPNLTLLMYGLKVHKTRHNFSGTKLAQNFREK